MGTLMVNNSADSARLLERTRAGDQAAVNEIFTQHRARLRRMGALTNAESLLQDKRR